MGMKAIAENTQKKSTAGQIMGEFLLTSIDSPGARLEDQRLSDQNGPRTEREADLEEHVPVIGPMTFDLEEHVPVIGPDAFVFKTILFKGT